MRPEPKSHRTEILVAIISVSGVLGAALIANWDKIFSRPVPSAPTAPMAAGPGISGVWHDVELGTTFQISQQGDSYTFTGLHPTFRTSGRGVVSGHALESTYQNNYTNGTVSTGTCTGTVSGDGTRTVSVCQDSMYGQRTSAVVR